MKADTPAVRRRVGKPRLRRVPILRSFALTQSQREILSILHEYSYLPASLIAKVYGSREGRQGRGYWQVVRQLRPLFDAGFVERFPGASWTAAGGSAETVYSITHLGAREVLEPEEYTRMRHHFYVRAGQRTSLAHHVAVATLQLVLTLGQQREWWRLLEFRAEDRNPDHCPSVRIRGRDLVARPDAWAVTQRGEKSPSATTETLYLFELDLTRRNNQRVSDRMLAYAGWVRERSVAKTPGPQRNLSVVFAVLGESEVERYLGIAARALAEHGLGTPRFLFLNLRDWFTVTAPGKPRADWQPTASTLVTPMLLCFKRYLSSLGGEPARLVDAWT